MLRKIFVQVACVWSDLERGPRGAVYHVARDFVEANVCFVLFVIFSACSKSANVENKFTDQLCELIFVSFIHLEAMQPSNAFQASHLEILKSQNLQIYQVTQVDPASKCQEVC